jgi:RNase P subunit RPR2
LKRIEKIQKASDFSSWFPKVLHELNAHYQKTGCESCHALLVEAKNKLGVKFVSDGGEKPI